MKVVMVGNVRTRARTLPPLTTSSEVICKVKRENDDDTLIEKKRLRGRVARMRRPEAIVSNKAQKPGPPSSAAESHGISLFLL